MISAKITFYHDNRRTKKDGKSPVKLRVYFQGKSRLYPVDLDLTEKEFTGATATNPRKNYLEYHEILEDIKEKAKVARDSLTIFTFEAFERKLYDTAPPKEDVPGYYHSYIEELERDGRVGTASSYSLSLKSLLGYHTYRAGRRKPEELGFLTIDKDWLKGFEQWMVENGKSLTTVGIYLRPLRAIFNQAIADGLITQEYYPFGKRKYQIPAGRNVKKALSKEDMKKLYEQPVEEGSVQEKAKDFWFLSYLCNGMNMKDILLLKYNDISDDKIAFVREKTKNTTKSNQKSIVVMMNDDIKTIIEKWGQKKASKNTFVFPVLDDEMDAKEKQKQTQNFTRFVNQHMKTVAKEAGITEDITTYWARHTFTTTIMRKGASIEMASGLLGHQSVATTKSYWAGFEDEAVKKVTGNLLDFDEG
jgi:integrase/recombinase XerD